jgi:2-isopropylmalate synthase
MEYYYDKTPISVKYYTEEATDDNVAISCNIEFKGEPVTLTGSGNGIIDAFCKILMDKFDIKFNIVNYSEHSLDYGNESRAITYIQIYDNHQNSYFGIGTSKNIAKGSLRAIVSAVNQMPEMKEK